MPTTGDSGSSRARGDRRGPREPARDLSNMPPNELTPHTLGEKAKKLAAEHQHLTCEVLATKELDDLGMGALTAVGRGSRNEPRLIVLRYEPPEPRRRSRARARRQVDHLRHRRDLDQAGRRDAGHEGRHVRRRRDAARDRRARRARHCRCARSPSSPRRRTCPAATRSGPATSSAPRTARRSRSSTPTPRAASSSPTRSGTSAREGATHVARSRDADRRDGARARRPLRRRLRERRRVARAIVEAGRAQRRPRLAVPAPSALPPLHRLDVRGHEERLDAAPGLARRSRPSSCTSSPATAPGAHVDMAGPAFLERSRGDYLRVPGEPATASG